MQDTCMQKGVQKYLSSICTLHAHGEASNDQYEGMVLGMVLAAATFIVLAGSHDQRPLRGWSTILCSLSMPHHEMRPGFLLIYAIRYKMDIFFIAEFCIPALLCPSIKICAFIELNFAEAC